MEYMNLLKNFILGLKKWIVLGCFQGVFFSANVIIFLDNSFLFDWIYNYTTPYFFLTDISIFIGFIGIYYYFSSLRSDKLWSVHNSSKINDTFSFTQLIAVPLHHSFVSLLLAYNLLILYKGQNLSPNSDSLVDQFTLIALVGFPIALYIYIMDKIEKKMIEEDCNDVIEIKAVSRKLDENKVKGIETNELVLANSDNDELKQFLIGIANEPELSPELYHQNYAAFVIAEGETTVFNKEELEDLFGFQNELGINLNSIDIDTFKLINRTDTEYCTSVIYEYDFDLKLIGSLGLKGKIVNHSIMLWTENGWLFLTDTQEI
jgi:hypothetical protein